MSREENKTLLGMSSEEDISNTNSPLARLSLSPQLTSSIMKKKSSPTQATEFTQNRVLDNISQGIGGNNNKNKKQNNNNNNNIESSSTDDYNGTELMELQDEKKKNKKNKKNKKKWKEMTPEERRIKEESEDAKSFFSNERTFLSWIGLTFSLGAIGTAIITFFGTEGVSLGTGLFLWIISIMFMAYSTIQFRRRGHAIRTKTQGPFDDQRGPMALVVMVVIGVTIYLVFFVVIRPEANVNFGGNNSTQTTTASAANGFGS